jgi:mannose-6-phosphate isomerase-like protein (cupin superfamily)
MQVRGHDPPTVSEAFTVLDGRLQITGPEGTEYVLEPDDFLFVPEYGKHANKNVGSDAVTYACLETPARSRTVSPAAPE